jgi:hypothetical protein
VHSHHNNVKGNSKTDALLLYAEYTGMAFHEIFATAVPLYGPSLG